MGAFQARHNPDRVGGKAACQPFESGAVAGVAIRIQVPVDAILEMRNRCMADPPEACHVVGQATILSGARAGRLITLSQRSGVALAKTRPPGIGSSGTNVNISISRANPGSEAEVLTFPLKCRSDDSGNCPHCRRRYPSPQHEQPWEIDLGGPIRVHPEPLRRYSRTAREHVADRCGMGALSAPHRSAQRGSVSIHLEVKNFPNCPDFEVVPLLKKAATRDLGTTGGAHVDLHRSRLAVVQALNNCAPISTSTHCFFSCGERGVSHCV